MSPSMKWITQFSMMKEKMEMAMWKLQNTPITASNACMFINMYLTTHVHFGCGIMKLLPKQEEILSKISEPVLLKKLNLSVKFPREILYARKLALGVGLMRPSTIVAMLKLQLYFGHMRMSDYASKMITTIEDNENFHHACDKDVMTVKSTFKMEQTTWCDEVSDLLIERNLSVANPRHNELIETQNLTIMEYAIKHAKENDLSKMLIRPINHMRYYKQMFLPCEIVGLRG